MIRASRGEETIPPSSSASRCRALNGSAQPFSPERSRGNAGRRGAAGRDPGPHRGGDEFRAVVGADAIRRAA
jgi:hypothetical protein